MGIGSRPATCVSCGKRLGRKQWYYRNGKYFCKKSCWETEEAKAVEEAAKAKSADVQDKPKDAAAITQQGEPAPSAPSQKTEPETKAAPEAQSEAPPPASSAQAPEPKAPTG